MKNFNFEKETFILEVSTYQWFDHYKSLFFSNVNYLVLSDFNNNNEIVFKGESFSDLFNFLNQKKLTSIKILCRQLTQQLGFSLFDFLDSKNYYLVDEIQKSDKIKELKKNRENKKVKVKYGFKNKDFEVELEDTSFSYFKIFENKNKIINFINIWSAVSWIDFYNIKQLNKQEFNFADEEEKKEVFDNIKKTFEILQENKKYSKNFTSSFQNQIIQQWRKSEINKNCLDTFYFLTKKNTHIYHSLQDLIEQKKAYKGGLLWVKEEKIAQDFSGYEYDINSAYAEAMLQELPVSWSAISIDDFHFDIDCRKTCFSRVKIKMITNSKIKNKKVPILVADKNENLIQEFKILEQKEIFIETKKELLKGDFLTITFEELFYGVENYDNFNFVLIKKWCNMKLKGGFDDIIKILFEKKLSDNFLTSKYGKKGITMLHSYFGKRIFLEDTILTNQDIGYVYEKKTKTEKKIMQNKPYYPVPTFVNSFVKLKLAKVINDNYDNVHYANTDGFLIDKKLDFIEKKGDISSWKPFYWKEVFQADKIRILGINSYCAWKLENDNFKYLKSAVGGLPKEQQRKLTPETFIFNKKIEDIYHYKYFHKQGFISTKKDFIILNKKNNNSINLESKFNKIFTQEKLSKEELIEIDKISNIINRNFFQNETKFLTKEQAIEIELREWDNWQKENFEREEEKMNHYLKKELEIKGVEELVDLISDFTEIKKKGGGVLMVYKNKLKLSDVSNAENKFSEILGSRMLCEIRKCPNCAFYQVKDKRDNHIGYACEVCCD